jgi:MFS family permease
VNLLADLTPLRESPDFRRLWAGSTLSAVGGAMTSFALSLQVWDLTQSTAAVGLVALATLLPLLAVGVLGGALIDAVDTRRLTLGCTSALAAISALLTVQAWLGLDQVGSLIPALLPARQQPAAQALQRIAFQTMMIVGPALAGVVAGAPHLGLRGCYLIDTLSFGCALYGVGSLPKSLGRENSPSDHPERTLLSSISAGFSFIGRTPVLAGAFLTDVCATFFGLPTSLFPALNAERSAATRGPWGCSWPRSAWAAWSPRCCRDRSSTSPGRARRCWWGRRSGAGRSPCSPSRTRSG